MKKRVFILQPSAAGTYRIGLFNALNNYEEIDLTVVYYSQSEERRKGYDLEYTKSIVRNFKEINLNTKVKHISYEHVRLKPNYLKFMLLILKENPDVIIAASHEFGKFLGLFTPFFKYKIINWAETTKITAKNRIPGKKAKYLYYPKIKANIIPGKQTNDYYKDIPFIKKSIPFYYAPNTVDNSLYSINREELIKKFRDTDTIKFVFAGSLIERKGFHLLKDAIKIMNKKKYSYKFELHCLGNGTLKEDIQNIVYPGFLNGNDYAEYLKSMHVLVLPSLWDCNPLVVIEAAIAGNIILLSDGVGCWPELCQDNGILFKRDSVEAIVEVLEKILKLSKEEMLKMAIRSLEISKEITHENSAKAFKEAIDYVLNQ
jgi:glycosyltransferase involved in cell wall biosynthesis